MYDTIIRGGIVHDGTGADPVNTDVAIQDGKIVEVGHLGSVSAAQVIDADGAIVAPSWIDLHTHMDGQVTWDDKLDPSSSHGVGTIVMGNCGVGFAPVEPGGEQELIDLMEGVEDIPGTALYEGIPWGAWSSYPEYLDFLASREYAIDISSLIPHGSVRNFVMGERGRNNEAATEGDLEAMGQVVEEALRAGSVGFSTSRILGHRSIHGDPVPGTFANDAEVMSIAQALKRAGKGIFQAIPSSTLGPGRDTMNEHSSLESEIDLISRVSEISGRRATFTLFQVDSWADKWREAIERSKANNQRGGAIYPQVSSRPTGMVLSLETYHPWMVRPTYKRLASLPLAERKREMAKPEIKAAILKEDNDMTGVQRGSMVFGIVSRTYNYDMVFKLDGSSTYEPTREESFGAQGAQAGADPASVFYDYLIGNGRHMAILFFTNYTAYNLDTTREMQMDDVTVTGLSDAGAHVSLIFDAVNPTYQMTYWGRDRTRGEKLPLPLIIHRGTQKNAALMGFNDRGAIKPGMKADINVIDFDNLKLGELDIIHDLPAGGTRLMQGATGYVASIINGVRTVDHDQDTGARPGRLVRSS